MFKIGDIVYVSFLKRYGIINHVLTHTKKNEVFEVFISKLPPRIVYRMEMNLIASVQYRPKINGNELYP